LSTLQTSYSNSNRTRPSIDESTKARLLSSTEDSMVGALEQSKNKKLALTHTFSECVENHAGMATTGTKADIGILEDELEHIAQNMGCAQVECAQEGEQNTVSLIEMAYNGERANVLVWKGGVDVMLGVGGADKLLQESLGKNFDTTYWDTRKKCVQNKHGRENNCYADQAYPPNVEAGRGTVHAFADSPMMAKLREALPTHFGPKTVNLFAETNKYTDVANPKVGIGFHGDTERRLVIGVRLGPASVEMPLRFQWYNWSKPISDETVIPLSHGDIYVMSNKATGFDWKCRSKTTLRHGAGKKAVKRPREDV